MVVDRGYTQLHQFQADAEKGGVNPNEWVITCESHAAVIFFGMDSAIECFVFTLNAIGCLKPPGYFCDITNARELRQIGPRNILGGDPTDKHNPKPGYQKFFPRVVACWKTHQPLLSKIFEYHDASKHRSAVATGGSGGTVSLRDDPKQPGSAMSSTIHTVESLAHEFQEFMDELLPIALEEAAVAFSRSVMKKPAGS
jgi:hypothetical protein